MIVISGVLVVLALVLLIAGVLADNLTLIYLSIATSAVSFLSLVFGVRQRKDEELPAGSSGGKPAAGAGALAGAGEGGSRSTTSSVALLERLDGPAAPQRSAPAPAPTPGDAAADAAGDAAAHRGSRRVDAPAAGGPPPQPARDDAAADGGAHDDADLHEEGYDEAGYDEDGYDEDGYDEREPLDHVDEAPPAHAAPVAAPPAAGGADDATEDDEYDDYEAYEDEASEGVVLVINGRPRYHVEGCRFVAGKDAEAIAVEDAREEGFTACGVCRPDEALAAAAAAYDDEYEDEYDDEAVPDEALAGGADEAPAPAAASAGADLPAAAGPRELGVTAVDPDTRSPAATHDDGVVDDEVLDDEVLDDESEHDEVLDDESEYEALDDEAVYDDEDAEDEAAGYGVAAPAPPTAVPAPGVADRGVRADAEPDTEDETDARRPAAVAEHDEDLAELDELDEPLDAPGPPRGAAAAAALPAPAVVEPVPATGTRARRVAAAAEAGLTAGAAEPTPGAARPVPSRRVTPTRGAGTRPATGRRPVRGAAAAPSPVPDSVPAPPPRTSTRGRVVVIPDRGRYHRPECRYVRESPEAVEITKQRATKQGYVACGVCKP